MTAELYGSKQGATRDVMVSASAFSRKHLWRLLSWLGLEFSGCFEARRRKFLRELRFPPLFRLLMVSADKNSYDKYDLNSVRLTYWAVPSYHMAHYMSHVISAQRVARDLNTTTP